MTSVPSQWIRLGILREDLALKQKVPATVSAYALGNSELLGRPEHRI